MKILYIVCSTMAVLCLAEGHPSKRPMFYCGRRLKEILMILCDPDYVGDIEKIHVTNLNDSCVRCLCHVAGCDTSHGCSGGYCGPFYISRVYWVDAGKPTLPDDDPAREEAFQDCARDYHCSIRIVKNYMTKYGKDCNEDGVTDCFDYMMINYHGGRACTGSLSDTRHGQRWLTTFRQCQMQFQHS